MRYAIIVTLLGFVLSVADAEEKLERQEVQVSPEVAKRCKQEGGCVLISRRQLEQVFNDNLQEGFLRGLQEGLQQARRRGGAI